MTERVLELLTMSTTLGTALVAGVFFTFSSFVIPGLARLGVGAGVAAMQAVNVAAITRSFMTLLFGTAVLCLALVVASAADASGPSATLRIVGASAYLLGAIAVTIAFNVPRNDALARITPESLDAAAAWTRYVREWTAWNHVRAVSSSFAAIALSLSR